MSRVSFLLACAVALALVPGCTLLFGGSFHVGTRDGGAGDAATPDGGTTDAGTGDTGMTDAGADAGPVGCAAPSGSVFGSAHERYVSASTEMAVPIDLRAYTVQAIVLSDHSVHDGTGLADGTFRIDGVPDGATYMLKLVSGAGATSFDVTDLRCVDIDEYVGGRPDATTVTVAQPMTLQLTNMQAWRTRDWIITEVFNTSTEGWQVDTIFDAPVAAGATTIDATYDFGNLNLNYSYRPGGRPALIDASHGDVFEIAHARRTDFLDGNGRLHETFAAIDVVDVNDVMMGAGTATTVHGAFSPITPTTPLRFMLNRAAFDAGYTDGQSRHFGTDMSVYGSPAADRAIGVGIPLAATTVSDWSGTAPRMAAIDVMYADPLPSTWPHVYDQRYHRHRVYRLPGTTTRYGQAFGINRAIPFAPPLPGMPDILPPSNVQVGGVAGALGGRVAFDGTSPVTISWNPVASSNHYRVQVVRLYVDGANTNAVFAATLQTRDTSVEVPAEAFTSGEFFFFIVAAIRDGGNYAAGHLRLQSFPTSLANNATGRFRFSASCGNSVTDGTEECDPGASASATCNLDCTLAACGDSVFNAAAGEACDTGIGTPTCTTSCHLPVCGDGFATFDLEDCDDGNTTDDGNGCDTTCHRNNVCGDGVIQNAIEDCDDGNTTDEGNGCDRACHANNVCGNGIVESQIEQCDPPNGTTCAADCTTI